MPLFMDVHDHVEGLTAEAVAGAHGDALDGVLGRGVAQLDVLADVTAGQRELRPVVLVAVVLGLTRDKEIEVRRPTLDDVFLNLTGRRVSEEGN